LASEITEPEILANSLWARSRFEIDSGNFESTLETYKKALYIVENELAKNSNVQAETDLNQEY
jgi:hypothetical protein